MSSCTLVAVAALAAVWSAPVLGPAPSTHAALRAASPKPQPKPAKAKRAAKTRQAGARPATGTRTAARTAGAPATAADAAAGLAATRSTAPIRIALVDTGVAPIAPLAPKLVPGADFVDTTGTTDDRNGHGTAMASIAASVCTTCALEPVRALGDSGLGTTALAAQGVRWAAASGARVINLSLTAPGPDDALTSAIESAVAGGAVVVVAAGNSGSTDPAAQGYPGAGAPDAITVTSVDPNRRLYAWSNHGSWVHLGAPGILDALSTRGAPMSAVGTSGSAAYVSGVAARLLTCDPSLTPAQVDALLQSSAKPVPSLAGGLVDPDAALAAAGCAA
ncbi:MAG TPA: S8 family serine peptidase [Gaiellaceae bacterium]|nr:S8 family serine peptidase [Gaiellaceae bacterium]